MLERVKRLKKRKRKFNVTLISSVYVQFNNIKHVNVAKAAVVWRAPAVVVVFSVDFSVAGSFGASVVSSVSASFRPFCDKHT